MYTTSVTPVGSSVLGVMALYIIWVSVLGVAATCNIIAAKPVEAKILAANKHSRRLTSSYVYTLMASLTSERTFPTYIYIYVLSNNY